MSSRATVCPHCGALIARDQRQCFRCSKPVAPPWARRLSSTLLGLFGDELPATIAILVACTLLFVVSFFAVFQRAPSDFGWLLNGGLGLDELLRFGALVDSPSHGLWLARGPLDGLPWREPFRHLTAVFLHLSGLHLVFNMMSLVSLGRALEPRLGSGRFALAFLLTGVAGFLASTVYYEWLGEPLTTAGASGGVFGLIGVLVGYFYARRDPNWKTILWQNLGLALALAFIMRVNTAAHLGGLVMGLPLGYLFYREKRPGRRNLWVNWGAALGFALALASLVACVRSPVTRAVTVVVEAQRALEQGTSVIRHLDGP